MAKLITIAYDGHCPVCSRYSRWRALARQADRVALEDVRELTAEQRSERYPGVDFDKGFAVRVDAQLLSGAIALQWLAAQDPAPGVLHGLHRWAFGGPRRARFFYPLLRMGRRGLLWVLGRGKINS